MKRFVLILHAVLLAILISRESVAQQYTISFDDISLNNWGEASIHNGYEGFNWKSNYGYNLYVLNAIFSGYSNTGYSRGTISPENVLFNPGGFTPSRISRVSGSFNFESAYFTSAWYDQQVYFEGYKNGALKYSSPWFEINTITPQLISLNWTDIDELVIHSTNWQWAMDNFTYSLPSNCNNPVASFSASAACLGTTTSFTDASENVAANATYAWDVDNDGETDYITKGNITHTYSAAGTYTAKLTVTQGTCSSSYTQQVTVKSLPTATLSGGGAICPGGNADLSIALTGTAPWNITYSDGTTQIVATNINTSPHTISVSPASTKTYSLVSASDANCNAASLSGTALVTVNSVPVVTVPSNISAYNDVNINGASVLFTATATGSPAPVIAYAINGTPITSPYTFPLGSTTVTATATNACGTDSKTFTVTVTKRPTVLEYITDFSKQYSDQATLKAKLTDQLTGDPIAGKTISFTLGGQTASVTTGTNGEAVTTLVIHQKPDAYTIASAFAGDAIYMASADSDPFTVQKEDARITYTGATFVSTSGASSGKATVTLSATIRDITAVAGDPAHDTFAGDIRKATVSFVNRDNNAVIATVPVGLVSSSDMKTGTATFNWNVDIGSASSATYTVGIVVNNYYTRNLSVDNETVTVSKPLNDFVTGGGYLVLANSAGIKAGDANRKNNFGFSIKYNSKGTNLQGHINIIVRRTEGSELRVYQIKGNSMTSLSVNAIAKTATFNGKASIQDITNPLSPISVDGNATLQVTMTDKGEPGTNDLIGITVWNKSGGLWYASEWSGTKTLEKQLSGGNLVIRGGSYSLSATATSSLVAAEPKGEPEGERFYSYPTAFSDRAIVGFLLEQEEDFALEVFDMRGALVKKLASGRAEANKLYEFELRGEGMAEGMYITRLSTISRVQSLKAILKR